MNGRIAERIYAASGDRTIVGIGLAGVYDQVDSQTREWARSAASGRSAELQKSVSELIGNEESFDDFAARENHRGLRSTAFTDAYAQAVYAETQALLAASPELSFRAARGTQVTVASATTGMGMPVKVVDAVINTRGKPAGDAMQESTWQVSTNAIGRQPLSSWSTSTKVANQFAALGKLEKPMVSPGVALVQRAAIPESQVFATALTGPGCLAEQEVLVMEGLPGKTSVSAILGYGGAASMNDRLIAGTIQSFRNAAETVDADGDGWILEGTDQAQFVGKADFVYDREVPVDVRSDGLVALLTWIPKNWDAAYKTDVAKGGPGSGAQPGHKFRGNQWTGGIPEGLDRGRVSSGIPRFDDSLLARPLTMKEAAARYGDTLQEVYQYVYDNYGIIIRNSSGAAVDDPTRIAAAYGNAQGLEVSLAALGPETRQVTLEGLQKGNQIILEPLKITEADNLGRKRWLGQYGTRTGRITQNLTSQKGEAWTLGQAMWWEAARSHQLNYDWQDIIAQNEYSLTRALDDLNALKSEWKAKHGTNVEDVDFRFDPERPDAKNMFDIDEPFAMDISRAQGRVRIGRASLRDAKRQAKKWPEELTVDDELYPPPFSAGSAFKQYLGIEFGVRDRRAVRSGNFGTATEQDFVIAAAMATMVHEMGHRVHQVTSVRSEIERARQTDDFKEFPFDGPRFEEEMTSKGMEDWQRENVQRGRLQRALNTIGYSGPDPRVELAGKAWEKWQPTVTSWTRYGQYGDRKYNADSRLEDWAENFAGYILLGADNMDWFAVPRWAKPKPNMDPKLLDPDLKEVTSFDDWLGEELILIEKMVVGSDIYTYPEDLSVESIWVALAVDAIKVTSEDQKRARKAYRERKKLAASVDQDD